MDTIPQTTARMSQPPAPPSQRAVSPKLLRRVLPPDAGSARPCAGFTGEEAEGGGRSSSYLEFFQDFVRFPAIFAKVLDLLALRAAAIVLHFSALRVQFGALGLVAHRPVLRAHARTVGVSRIEALPEFVDEAAVVHAAFPPVVIENDAVSGAPLRLVRGVILGVTHRGGRHGTQSQQEHKGGREEGGHPCEHNPHSVGA